MDRFFRVPLLRQVFAVLNLWDSAMGPIIFKDRPGFKKQEALITIIKYKDYRVEVDTPAEEKVSQASDAVLPAAPDI